MDLAAEFARMPTAHNWDSYGGFPHDPTCQKYALAFVEWCGKQPTHVYPLPNGGVGLNFGDDVEFDFKPDGDIGGYIDPAPTSAPRRSPSPTATGSGNPAPPHEAQ